jgi:hypothetical protein
MHGQAMKTAVTRIHVIEGRDPLSRLGDLLVMWPDTPHAFQLAPFLPASTRALNQVAACVAKRTGWSVTTQGTPAKSSGRR